MPIRIREVHIKATVVADEETTKRENTKELPVDEPADIQEIVNQCVHQVLRQLQKREER